MTIEPVRQALRDQKIDGWLIYDFRGGNPVLAQLLPGRRFTTRRVFLLIPAAGEPVLLVHAIDASQFVDAGVASEVYLSWQQMRQRIEQHVRSMRRVAMEYSPGGALPVVSVADAGTVEMVRSAGAEVVSSADLIQLAVATWSAEARRRHDHASREVARIKDGAFELIRARLRDGSDVTERQVQQFILDGFRAAGLETPDAPIVAVNRHSGDPHFEVSPDAPSPVRRDDWVLIDLWARVPGDENLFSDITWVGYAGAEVPPRHRQVFETVKRARDAALTRASDAWRRRLPVAGWQLDDAAREVLIAAGFEPFIRHRTGHSLSPGPRVHGMGVNLDNLETHDTRLLLPGVGFTIEPGLYLPEFGVRLEINVHVDPQSGPTITSCVQDDVIRLA